MPVFQRLLERANSCFASKEIVKLNADMFSITVADPQELMVEAASRLKIATTDAERAVIRRCPASLQAAIVSVARSAVQRSTPEAPVPIVFSWVSGYDFELTVFEARPGPTSWGGITVVLRSPYPE